MTFGIITAIYGGYDELRELPDGHGFDQAIAITDSKQLTSSTWTVIYDPRPGLHPRLAAKYPKLLPFDYLTTEVAAWIDGAFRVTDPGFRAWLEEHPERDLTAWAHPERSQRDCIYLEAALCQDWPKYRGYDIRGQVDHYRSMGYPDRAGLYACGTLLWRDTPTAHKLALEWLAEIENWSIQDQISLPYLLALEPRSFGTFDAEEFANPYLAWTPHRDNL